MRTIRYWPRFLGRDNTMHSFNRISRGEPPNLSLKLQPPSEEQSRSKEIVTHAEKKMQNTQRLNALTASARTRQSRCPKSWLCDLLKQWQLKHRQPNTLLSKSVFRERVLSGSACTHQS